MPSHKLYGLKNILKVAIQKLFNSLLYVLSPSITMSHTLAGAGKYGILSMLCLQSMSKSETGSCIPQDKLHETQNYHYFHFHYN